METRAAGPQPLGEPRPGCGWGLLAPGPGRLPPSMPHGPLLCPATLRAGGQRAGGHSPGLPAPSPSPWGGKGRDRGPWASCRGRVGWDGLHAAATLFPGMRRPEVRGTTAGRVTLTHNVSDELSLQLWSQRGALDAREGEDGPGRGAERPAGRASPNGGRRGHPRGLDSRRARAQRCPGGPRPRASRSRCARR